MDKLQSWLQRIQQPPRREVANLDFWELLSETRIAQEGGASAERLCEVRGQKRCEEAPRRRSG
jgi:hypothetical protein